jgi:hypothetical protein
VHTISDPYVFETFGSEISWVGLSIHTEAQPELGVTCKANAILSNRNRNSNKDEVMMNVEVWRVPAKIEEGCDS